MTVTSLKELDDRDVAQLLQELQLRRENYLPRWNLADQGPAYALAQVHSRYLHTLIQRLNQVPEKLKLAFLETIGLELTGAQPARTVLVFQMAANANTTPPGLATALVRAPERTQVAGEPPPGSNLTNPIVFETEQALGLTGARVQKVVSLWPGRDQYIDHTEQFAANEPIRPFDRPRLKNTPHELYIAHQRLLALSGSVQLDLAVELRQVSNEHLKMSWQYWDGDDWRKFDSTDDGSTAEQTDGSDGTEGFQRSGQITLVTDCSEAATTTVNGIESFWIRGVLEEPLVPATPKNDDKPGNECGPEPLKPPASGADVNDALPEIGQLRLSSIIKRDLAMTRFVEGDDKRLRLHWRAGGPPRVVVKVTDTDGHPVEKARVSLTHGRNDSWSGETNAAGAAELTLTLRGDPTEQLSLEILFHGKRFRHPVTLTPLSGDKEHGDLPITLQITGLVPDAALSNGQEVDISAPFAPFGPIPQPGSVFYLSSEEAFGKPGAELKIHLQRALTPDDQASPQIAGAVLARRSAPLPGVAVQVLQGKVEVDTTMTAEDGRYAVSGLSAGDYEYTLKFSGGGLTADVTVDKIKIGAFPLILNVKGGTPELITAGTKNRRPMRHQVTWEYWDGSVWAVLKSVPSETAAKPEDFSASGPIKLKVPSDFTRTEVQGRDALWLRARLAIGGYGYTEEVTWKDEEDNTNRFTYVVHQPPMISGLKITYVWQDGPKPADYVLTYNDFEYTDQSLAARAAGESFLPFSRVADVLPAVYLGLDKKLPVDRVSMYFDITEDPGDESTPAILWEFWNGFRWHRLTVEEDRTSGLASSEVVSLIGPADAHARNRFARELYWLRARMTEDGPPFTPEIRGLHLNAVWASQRETVLNQSLGTSSGLPDQILTFPRAPVLDDEQIEVRELSGERANVQWRILVRDLFSDPQLAIEPQEAIRQLEQQLDSETRQPEITLPPVRLRRVNNKKVGEVWVRWERRSHLYDSDENDRHYMLEPARGRVFFGNGQLGMIPPLDAVIRCRRFTTGGGSVGNLGKGTVNQLLGGVAGVEVVFNVRPSEGGANGESLTTFAARGPRALRHRGRAVTTGDYETMAREASPAVAVVHATANLTPDGRRVAGWVTLVVIPHSEELRPQPSPGLRERIRSYIAERSDANLQVARQVYVTGPEYWPIHVAATIAPVDPAAAGAVEMAARVAVERFLHPLYGGPGGQGWPPGRFVYLSDLAAVLERAEGVDYVRELTLLVEGTPQGESAFVPTARFAVAGDIRVKLVS